MIAYSASETYPQASITPPPVPSHAPIQALQELGQFCIQGDIESFTRTLNSSSIASILHASLPIVNLLLNRGGDVTKGQVLHHAVARESDAVEVLKLLIAQGAPINGIMYRDHQPSWDMYLFMGETPLHKAVFLRKVDVIHYLLGEGAELNVKDVRNRTALQCADEDIRREITKWSQY
ncbi:hypothetical protein LT330_000461 [Penicillium expansum]|nr:hypothetical protein LT330_000461 [Penicillium expansum]